LREGALSAVYDDDDRPFLPRDIEDWIVAYWPFDHFIGSRKKHAAFINVIDAFAACMQCYARPRYLTSDS
jgi:hypothetical protein